MHQCKNVLMRRVGAVVTDSASDLWSRLLLPHPQGATVRVKIINSVTLAVEGYAGSDGLMPYTVNATTAPYVVQAATANRWNAIIRNANNQAGTFGSPIPHAGSWRFQIAVVSAPWAGRHADLQLEVVSIVGQSACEEPDAAGFV